MLSRSWRQGWLKHVLMGVAIMVMGFIFVAMCMFFFF
jgi:hypothetical protein